jgi:hypothetical protein
MQIRVISECYVDTALARFFTGDVRLVDHQSGIGEVGNAMKKTATKNDEILIAWIDNDRVKPSYFADFQTIIEENNVLVKQLANSNRYLIIIQPAAEKFLLEAAKELQVDFKLFQLPSDLKEFSKFTKNPNIEQNVDFQLFIKYLSEGKAVSFETLSAFFESFRNL